MTARAVNCSARCWLRRNDGCSSSSRSVLLHGGALATSRRHRPSPRLGGPAHLDERSALRARIPGAWGLSRDLTTPAPERGWAAWRRTARGSSSTPSSSPCPGVATPTRSCASTRCWSTRLRQRGHAGSRATSRRGRHVGVNRADVLPDAFMYAGKGAAAAPRRHPRRRRRCRLRPADPAHVPLPDDERAALETARPARGVREEVAARADDCCNRWTRRRSPPPGRGGSRRSYGRWTRADPRGRGQATWNERFDNPMPNPSIAVVGGAWGRRPRRESRRAV